MKAGEYFSRFPFAELRSQNGLYKLKFCTYAYEFPHIHHGDDADWHRNCILLTLPSFRAEMKGVTLFQGGELALFLHQLRRFSALKRKKVEFSPMEGYIRLLSSLTRSKHVHVQGEILDQDYRGRLKFDFETDLTYVETFVTGIQRILKGFPPRH